MKVSELIYMNAYLPVLFHFSRSLARRNGILARLRGYKTSSMLNSTEHEISNAHKFKYISRNSAFCWLR